jgi:hypothetical protein
MSVRLLAALIVTTLCLGTGEALGATCKTSSGSECNVKCDGGATASATCQSDSKICSCACSTTNSSLAQNLADGIQKVSGGQLSRRQAEDLLQGNFDFQRAFRKGPQQLRFQGKQFTIEID